MEEPRRKFSAGTLGVILILIILAGLIVLYAYYFKVEKSNTPATEGTDQTQSNYDSVEGRPADTTGSDSTPSGDNNAPTLTDVDYYNQAVASIENKNYDEALKEINKAIELNQKNDIYWAKKASIYALKGNTESEKTTLQDGLKLIPNSDLLKTRIDLLNSDIGSDLNGVRE